MLIKGILEMNYMGDSHWWNYRFKLRSLNIINQKIKSYMICVKVNIIKYILKRYIMIQIIKNLKNHIINHLIKRV